MYIGFTEIPHRSSSRLLVLSFQLKNTLAIAALVLCAAALLVFGGPDEKRISIYSTAANYSLPVLSRYGQDYVGLLEILEPLGSVNSKTDSGRWKLRYNKVQGEFAGGTRRCRIAGRDFDLAGNFLLENGRGLLPLASLSTLLPQFLGGPVSFHETSRRLFVGDVAVHFTAQVKGSPAALVMDFSSPVNPSIATEPGKLRMVFTHEPLVPPGAQTLTFNNSATPSVRYDEANGAAEITVSGTVPLFAKFTNDGRTITVTAAPEAAKQSSAPPVPAQTPVPATTASVPAAASITGPRRYFAVVDASHGGAERGAALTAQMAEKDVTLSFARRLRQELENRGLSTLLVRDGDITIGVDQRASMANSAHPAIYICLHASSVGSGVRIYTALVPNVADARGPFLTWETAQAPFRATSQSAAAGLSAALERTQVPVRNLVAPLGPLANVIAPAVGVEVAPPATDVSELNSTAYQQVICTSLAAGLASMRDKLEAGR